MREVLLISIFVATSLIFQVFFLRVFRDKFNLKKDDPRFRHMVQMIYVNFGIYLILIVSLLISLLKQ